MKLRTVVTVTVELDYLSWGTVMCTLTINFSCESLTSYFYWWLTNINSRNLSSILRVELNIKILSNLIVFNCMWCCKFSLVHDTLEVWIIRIDKDFAVVLKPSWSTTSQWISYIITINGTSLYRVSKELFNCNFLNSSSKFICLFVRITVY